MPVTRKEFVEKGHVVSRDRSNSRKQQILTLLKEHSKECYSIVEINEFVPGVDAKQIKRSLSSLVRKKFVDKAMVDEVIYFGVSLQTAREVQASPLSPEDDLGDDGVVEAPKHPFKRQKMSKKDKRAQKLKEGA